MNLISGTTHEWVYVVIFGALSITVAATIFQSQSLFILHFSFHNEFANVLAGGMCISFSLIAFSDCFCTYVKLYSCSVELVLLVHEGSRSPQSICTWRCKNLYTVKIGMSVWQRPLLSDVQTIQERHAENYPGFGFSMFIRVPLRL